MSPARGVSKWLRPRLCGIDLYQAIFTESSEKWQNDPPKIDRLAADISLEALRELSGGFAVSASTFLCCQPLADFTNPTVETAGRACLDHLSSRLRADCRISPLIFCVRFS